MSNQATIRKTLEIFCRIGTAHELRAPKAEGKKCVCEVYNNLEEMARRAAELDQTGCPGVYFTPNPVRPELAGWKDSRLKAEDIIRRHWLLLDFDTWRPVNTNANEAELTAAWMELCCARGTLSVAGFLPPVTAFSGNGWHMCYAIDEPNDLPTHEKLKLITEGLRERCADPISRDEEKLLKNGEFLPTPKVKIDSTWDAPRIWKLYGTWARKGPHTATRPHRQSFILEAP